MNFPILDLVGDHLWIWFVVHPLSVVLFSFVLLFQPLSLELCLLGSARDHDVVQTLQRNRKGDGCTTMTLLQWERVSFTHFPWRYVFTCNYSFLSNLSGSLNKQVTIYFYIALTRATFQFLGHIAVEESLSNLPVGRRTAAIRYSFRMSFCCICSIVILFNDNAMQLTASHCSYYYLLVRNFWNIGFPFLFAQLCI